MTESDRSKPDLSRLKIDKSSQGRPSLWGPFPKIIGLSIVAVVAWFGWQKFQSPPDTTAPAKPDSRLVVVDYAADSGAGGVSGNGYVIARRRAALSTVLSGRLVEIHVEEGTRVSAGQVVARIQYDDYENALTDAKAAWRAAGSRAAEIASRAHAARSRIKQAEAAVQVAVARKVSTQTDLEQAVRDRERNRKSYDEKDLSEARWDELVTRVVRLEKQQLIDEASVAQAQRAVTTAQADVAAIETEAATQKAEVARAHAGVESASILLEKTYVRAPFGGVIVNKGAEEGEVVAATGAGGNSRGSVATLVDLETLEVQVELPETRLAGIREEQAAEIFLDVAPRKAWAGRVRQIWPTADRGKGTVEIRIVFESRPEQLRPEMGARVVFLNARAAETEGRKALVIPTSAIVRAGDKQLVWVVESGLLRRTEIKTGEARGALTPVTSGLEAGMKIVDQPRPGLKEGSRYQEGL